MRILQVVGIYGNAGGVENHTYDIAAALERAGHTCAIAYASAGLDLHHVEGRSEYQIPGLTDRGWRGNPAVAERLAAVVDMEQPDVAYVHTFLEFEAAKLILRRLPTVFFSHTHDLYCPAGSKYLQRTDSVCPYPAGAVCFVQAFLERCQSRRPKALAQNYLQMQRMQRWAQQVDVLQVNSEDMRGRLVATGFPPSSIAVVPTHVRIPVTVAPTPPAHLDPTVLFAGRLTPHKGLRYLIEAMRLSRVPYRLAVAGEGYATNDAVALAQQLGVASRVEFLGWAGPEKMVAIYDACAMVVVPSVWPEPFCLVGREAMGHAKPVVAFNLGGNPDWLEHGVTGFLVPPKDVRGLADRIDQVLGDPNLSQRMGLAGRSTALRLYGLEQHVPQVVSLLERAIQRRAVNSLGEVYG